MKTTARLCCAFSLSLVLAWTGALLVIEPAQALN
jgi:hypothetical protein